ncbi:uncharacterized protein LOC135679666 isoform X2 [Musa acuminata AAA Group]|uniref:uncharacterized protein LOC135679666 isoform X2 n=1 Tax=Musa acuminata AAA Group TaxID=214697 RepID=UPI0031DECFEF
MEGSFGGGGDDGIGKNGGPSDGRPPNPFAGASRQFMGGAHGESPCKSALGRHDSLVAVPGALFEDKPQSANDTWRKLHSDPLLLIRQREQEALARIKNNPIKMAMIKKSVEDEKKKKQDKKEKKRHKDHHHSRSKDDKRSLRRYSDSDLKVKSLGPGMFLLLFLVVPNLAQSHILFQGFNWESWRQQGGWYNFLKDKVSDITNAGVTHVWLPPPSHSAQPLGCTSS